MVRYYKMSIFNWINSKIGAKLFLSFSIVLLLILLSMTYLAIYFVVDFGKFAAVTNETAIRQQTSAFLSRITHEQSMHYEDTFRRIAGASALLAQNAAYLLDQSIPKNAGFSAPELTFDDTTQVYVNHFSDPFLVLYDGRSGRISSEIYSRIQTLVLLEPHLEGILKNNAEVTAAYILTNSGIRQQYPNPHKNSTGHQLIQYDMMNSYFYGVANPKFNPDKKTVWTHVYPGDMGTALIITASTPIYNKANQFIGAAGIDITINAIVNEILSSPNSHMEMSCLIPFLIDANGVILAMDKKHLNTLGLPIPSDPETAPGTVLVQNLFDSKLKEIKEISRHILSKDHQVSNIKLGETPYFISSHNMPSTGWRLCVVAPEPVMLASIDKTQKALINTVDNIKLNFFLLSIVFLLLGLVLLTLLIRNFVRPLRDLTRAATKVKLGELGTKVPVTRNDEIGKLGQSFNSMLIGLQKARKMEKAYTQTLKLEVETRTREIKLKNLALENTLVSLKKEMKERMRAEEERIKLTLAVEQAAESICIMNARGKIQYLNPAAEKLFELKDKTVSDINPFLYRNNAFSPSVLNKIWATISTGRVWKGELGSTRNGKTSEIDATISPIRDSNNGITHYIALCRDISNEKKLQKELRQAQKMEAIGTFAGGIAHDFNNILMVIIGYTELCLDDHDKESKTYRHLREVLNASGRARDLVQQILTFSRKTDQKLRPIKVAPIIKETVKFLKASVPATIQIVHSYNAENDLVLSDPTQIHQILMNLCANAKDAMNHSSGTMEVQLNEETIFPEKPPADLCLAAGHYLVLSISDTGCGMDRELLDKIFDPFYTTKEPGKGTGLGLSVVHGIIRSCGGDIRVTSELNKGSRFDVYFPMVRPHTTTVTPLQARETLAGGKEHILVVDDEPQIAHLTGLALEKLGYRVTARSNSRKALAVFQKDPYGFDMLITDQTMPDMTGKALAENVLQIRADIPIILCTGYSEVIGKEHARKIGISAFLSKPVTQKTLAETVRNMLDRKTQASAAENE